MRSDRPGPLDNDRVDWLRSPRGAAVACREATAGLVDKARNKTRPVPSAVVLQLQIQLLFGNQNFYVSAAKRWGDRGID